MKQQAVLLVGALAIACGQGGQHDTASVGGASSAQGKSVDAAGDGGASGASDRNAPADGGAAGEDRNAVEGGAAGEGGVAGESGAAGLALPASCAADTSVPPGDLACTGLYADVEAKRLAPGVLAYAPAVPLWSDGADKQRWISLPNGGVIDNSDPNEWSFPVGTKVWKEFRAGGSRIETRLWMKADVGYWVNATYAWNADESSAQRSRGGDISLGTRSYHIPTPDECEKCHRGRTDRILGFEQALLGMAGATGFNLEQLIAQRRLSNPPKTTLLVIGDDGTKLAAPALAWLHVNCGVTCHNRNSNATAWSTGMFLRLDATLLDGRSSSAFDSRLTTVGAAAVTPAWHGQTRIAAGDPAHSLLYQLITQRGTDEQMPPIASNIVDAADTPLVQAWIDEMPIPSAGAGGQNAGGQSAGGQGAGGGGNHTPGGHGGPGGAGVAGAGTGSASGGSSAGSANAGNGGSSASDGDAGAATQ